MKRIRLKVLEKQTEEALIMSINAMFLKYIFKTFSGKSKNFSTYCAIISHISKAYIVEKIYFNFKKNVKYGIYETAIQ